MITEFIEPAFRPVSEMSGISTEDLAVGVGGEAAGVATEMLTNAFTKGWMNIGVNFATGLITVLGALFGRRMPVRTKRELIQWGAHCLGRLPVKLQEEWVEVKVSIDRLMSAIRRGDVNAALASGLKTPAEIRARVTQFVPAGAGGTPTPTPPARSTGGGEKKRYVLVK